MALDWRILKKNIYVVIIQLIAVTIIGMTHPVLVLPFLTVLLTHYTAGIFALEDKSELYNLYLMMPLKRCTIVKARYLLSMIGALIAMIVGTPIMLLCNRYGSSHYHGPFAWYLCILAATYCVYAISSLMIFPALFREPYGKAGTRGFLLPILILCTFFIAFMAVSVMPAYSSLTFDLLEFGKNNFGLTFVGLTVLATFILIISYRRSQRLYAKRDF
jgi:hypothetical protein